MSCSMNRMYDATGISKQNFHQQMIRADLKQEEAGHLWELMLQLREDHPMMGARTMYDKLLPREIGRDAFIELYNEAGMRVRRYRNYRRTTDSSGVKRFDNLTEGLELTHADQAYCSDMTYYEMNGKFCYLTFIMDMYSRRIVGWKASRTLRTEDTTIPCMQQLLQRTTEQSRPIFHSDGGGQYYSKEFLKLTGDRFRNSMGKSAYENPKAERLNGTVKNDYLLGYGPKNFQELKKMLDRAVSMYNRERPHRALNRMTPVEFERSMIRKKKKKDVQGKKSTETQLCLTDL